MGKEITMGSNFNRVSTVRITVGQIGIERIQYIQGVLCKLAGSGKR